MSLRSGLVAEYHLDTLNDTSGNNINLTNTGTTLTTDKNGVVNKARLSNGTQYLRGSANTALNTQTLTASVWIKITSYAYTRVINYGNSTLNTMGYILGINSNGTLRSLLYKGSWLSVAGTSVIPLNTWTMITMTYDGSNRRLYVNGQLEVTFAETGSITYGTMSLGINTSSYTVGELLNGAFDEIKIYNRALTSYEIYQLYIGYDTTANQVGTLRSGLISEYHLDTTTDTGSNGFNLTTNGAPTLTTDKNGVVNKARNLSSGNNYHFSPINWALYNSYTISCWVKNGLGAGQYFLYIQRDNPNIFFNYLTVYQNKASLVYASGLTLQSTSVINDNVWHLVTTTYDGSNVKMYVDGKLETSVAHTGNVTQTGGSYTTMTQDIGYNNISTSQPYVGSLDELKIYDRALSDTEILMLYYGYDTTADSIDTLTQGLIAGYHLDTLNDSSGNGNTLTNSGTTLTTDKLGVVNKARNFNGVSTLNTPTITNLPTNEVSISYWQKPLALANKQTFSLSPDNSADRINVHCPWSDGIVYFDYGNTGTGRLSYTPPSSIIGGWNHFVLQSSLSGNYMRIYRNGVLEASKVGRAGYSGANSILSLGGGTSSIRFSGDFDEFRMYNRQNTEDEIIELNYNYDVPTMSAISAPTGYSKKVNGVTPSKVNGVVVANISKVNGI